MTAGKANTLREVILEAADRFEQAGLGHTQGMPAAIDEAVYLCLSAMGLPLDCDTASFDNVPTPEQRVRIQDYLRQRLELRKPAAYITGYTRFAGYEFYVDERVLIPRSPFAELIANHFRPWLGQHYPHNILDLCTGSGCIAIACAHAFPDARVTAADISTDALEVAAINVQHHGLQQRLTLVESDLFSALQGQRYDLIVSNPPYVSRAEMQELNAEFDYEPALGLVAGEQGLDFVIPILQQAREHLTDHGVLFVELGFSWHALQDALPQVPFMWLEFEFGGEGVFMLTAQQLQDCQPYFDDLKL